MATTSVITDEEVSNFFREFFYNHRSISSIVEESRFASAAPISRGIRNRLRQMGYEIMNKRTYLTKLRNDIASDKLKPTRFPFEHVYPTASKANDNSPPITQEPVQQPVPIALRDVIRSMVKDLVEVTVAFEQKYRKFYN